MTKKSENRIVRIMSARIIASTFNFLISLNMALVNMSILYSWLLISFVYAANIILPPSDSTKSGQPVGLIYIIGADILPPQYVQLCETIQSKFPQPLYVGIPSFLSPDASVPEFVNLLPDLLKEMESKGLPKNSPIFMAGHRSLYNTFLLFCLITYITTTQSRWSSITGIQWYISR